MKHEQEEMHWNLNTIQKLLDVHAEDKILNQTNLGCVIFEPGACGICKHNKQLQMFEIETLTNSLIR